MANPPNRGNPQSYMPAQRHLANPLNRGNAQSYLPAQRHLLSGALNGFEVWLWYAVIEFVFGTFAPLLMKKQEVMTPGQWRGTVLIFGCYAAIGVLTGAIGGLLVRGEDGREWRTRKLLLFVLIAAFGLNIAFAPLQGLVKAASLIAVALIAIAAAMNLWTGRDDAGYHGDAAGVSASLIVSAFLAQELFFRFPPVKLVAVVTVVTLFFIGLAVAVRRVMVWLAARWRWAPLLESAFKAAATLGLIFGAGIISSHAEMPISAWQPPVAASGPNIILITLDTVAAGHMGIYGYERQNTPNLRALANEATFYQNFIAAAPVTLTSHASIFTGLYPQSHGAYTVYPGYPMGRPLPKTRTMASILSAAGYHTMAVMANRFYLRPEWGMTQGFEYAYWAEPVILVGPSSDYLLRNAMRHALTVEGAPQDLDARTITAEDVNKHAYSLLDSARGQSAPFFLFLNYTDAHSPYLPPAPYDTMYPGKNPEFTLSDYQHVTDDVNNGSRDLDPASRNHMVSQYDGAIAYLDAKLGELVAYLKRTGLYDRTMLVVTSDHGEVFGERKLVGHDVSVYQDQVHVPLIVKFPGQTQPQRVDALGSHVDLLPTLLDVAHLPAQPGLEGVSLMKPEALKDRAIVAEYHNSAMNAFPRFLHTDYALFYGASKMIYSTSTKRELYDLSTDPDEQHNLYQSGLPLVTELRGKLEAWSRNAKPQYANATQSDADAAKRLESLGYAR